MPELFFITPEWRDSAVTVFDIAKDPITELGSFRGSSPADDKFTYSIFENEGIKVLHGESYLTTGFANPTAPVTDYYITYDGKDFKSVQLYRVESKNGNEAVYFESPYDNTEISKSEYEKRRKEAERNGKIIDTITVSGKDIEFLEENNLKVYVLSLLDKWYDEHPN